MSKRAKQFNQKYQREWSEKHKYKHIHTGEHCTFEAFIAEYLVLRWTEAFKMEKPSYKFWTEGDKYHDAFMRNMKAVCSLQKKYDPATILAAVKSKHFENIYHIGLKAYGPRGWKYNQVAVEAIKRYNKEHQDFLKLCDKTAKEEVLEEQPDQEKLKHRTKQYSKKKNSINKLRDL
jgi:formyltetrahydrofolate synthetase